MNDRQDEICPLYRDGCAHGKNDRDDCDKKGLPHYLECKIFRMS